MWLFIWRGFVRSDTLGQDVCMLEQKFISLNSAKSLPLKSNTEQQFFSTKILQVLIAGGKHQTVCQIFIYIKYSTLCFTWVTHSNALNYKLDLAAFFYSALFYFLFSSWEDMTNYTLLVLHKMYISEMFALFYFLIVYNNVIKHNISIRTLH